MKQRTIRNSILTNQKFDVVIAGAGISGMLTAYMLQLNGFRCCVIEENSAGTGSTSFSTGLLQYETDKALAESDNPEAVLQCYHDNIRAITELRKIVMQYAIDCEWKDTENLCLAFDNEQKEGLIAEYDAQREAGFACELIPEKQLKDIYGLNAKYAMSTGNGASVNASKLVSGLLKVFLKKGRIYLDHTRLLNYQDTEQNVSCQISHEQHETVLHCAHLIIATGYHKQFLPRGNLQIRNTYSTRIRTNEDFQMFSGNIWDCNDPYFYLRGEGLRSFLLGGLDEDIIHPVDENKLRHKEEKLRRYFHTISGITQFSMESTKACRFISTRDGMPVIGPSGDSGNVIYAFGFGGNGIVFSTIAADLIKCKLMGKLSFFPDRYSAERLITARQER